MKYTGTIMSDYKITDEEILDTVDSAYYMGDSAIVILLIGIQQKRK